MHVVLVGAGNIGSHEAPLLVRMNGVTAITVVDPDKFDCGNLRSQAIGRAVVGRGKAAAVAATLRQISPGLIVNSFAARAEAVPAGRLRCDILVAGVDSRLTRMNLGRIQHRLGIPFYVDAGVAGAAGSRTVRVSVFGLGSEVPCYQCGFSEMHYQNIDLRYPCQAGKPGAPTNAPAWLGAMAASTAAWAVERLLGGDTSGVGFETRIDASKERPSLLYARLINNPRCRFDHDVWPLPEQASQSLGVSELVSDDCEVRSAGGLFAVGARCDVCARTSRRLRHCRFGVNGIEERCACGGVMRPTALDWRDVLTAEDIRSDRSLRGIGLRAGDLLLVSSPDGRRALELGD